MDYLFFLLECPCKVCVWGECVFVILARSEQLILRGNLFEDEKKRLLVSGGGQKLFLVKTVA